MKNINQIVNHINEADFFKAFLALDELKIQSHQLASMKKEFISGKYGYDFADRLLTFVNNLNTALESSGFENYKKTSTVNQYGDKSVYIERNEGKIVIK